MLFPKNLQREIDIREKEGGRRRLINRELLVDFTSNDYLGFSSSNKLKDTADKFLKDLNIDFNGASASRLLSGNKNYHVKAESIFANFFKDEAALVFNSGYSANIGLLSAVLKRGSVVLYDELSHASIRDGIRLGFAKAQKFSHNSVVDLRQKLQASSGELFVVVESVYSMDGDVAPLKQMVELCKEFQANLIVDEAHSTGLYGSEGQGLVVEQGLENEVFARIHTFGKAMGSQGGVVVGSNKLVQFLVNFSRPFIYTTALAPYEVALMVAGIGLSQKASKERSQLQNNISYFKSRAKQGGINLLLNSSSQIQGILVNNAEKASSLSEYLMARGIDARAIKSPTVPIGKERIRICLHTYNTNVEIEELIESVREFENE